MTRKKLKKVFHDFNKLKVLIIGDVMVDTYMWGKVHRISPEAPVPIVVVNNREHRMGGAANVAQNVKALGATPIICSVIGTDDKGELFLDLLKEQKLTSKGILKSRGRITTNKTRILSSNHQMLRVDEEIETNISETETDHLLTHISYLIKSEKVDVVIFEDYDKGLITPRLIKKIVELSIRHGIPTVVDPKKKNFNEYKGVTLFKPNLKELKEGQKREFDPKNNRQLQKVVDIFRERQEIVMMLITLSERGIYVNTKDEKKIIPAHIRNVADVSGAGDTVVSVAALCLALKLSPEDIATLANLAGGLVCEKVGAVPIEKEQLLREALKL